MKKCFYLMMMGCLLVAGCSSDSSSVIESNTDNSGQNKQQKDEQPSPDDSCKSPKVLCGESCLDLAKLHLKDCDACEDGYEPKDDLVTNGCKKEGDKPACSVGVDCDGDCVVLEERHWKSCGVCASGYEDADGKASNGCEKKQELECENPYVPCDDECVNFGDLHWSDCHVCAEGYEDADGKASNGCENAKKQCEQGLTPCGEDCLDLAKLHQSNCTDCAAGYEDADGDTSNGCEKDAAACEKENEVRCGDKCVVLADLHWSDCSVCVDGYRDADEDIANGCETKLLPGSECLKDEDCMGLFHVKAASCKEQKCIISACEAGYADCDKAAVDGCEAISKSDYYHCGAKGFCSDSDTKSENYTGVACKLGEQCLDGACKPVPEIVGCADGTREGFLDLVRFNNIAACGGAWTIPGIHHDEGPACKRNSGNTSSNPEAKGCNIEDLCAEGWHVCLGRDDVRTRSESGCNGILDNVDQNKPWLFITRTSSRGSLLCDPDTVGVPLNMNDIFGCGNFGCYATGNDCDPLKLSSHNLCSALRNKCGCVKEGGSVKCNEASSGNPCYGGGVGHSIDYFSALNGTEYKPAWDCSSDKPDSPDGWQEARDIVKSLPDQQGGVMCCKNQCNKDADCGAGLLCRYNVCVQCIQKADKTYEGCAAGQKCTSSHVCVKE